MKLKYYLLLLTCLAALSGTAETVRFSRHEYLAADFRQNPTDRQIGEQLARLQSGEIFERSAAAEALGFMRAYRAEAQLVQALKDSATEVRREAALALAWCGGRNSVAALLGALDDTDWVVGQAAAVALSNITGMDFPFDALAKADAKALQIAHWKSWCETIPAKAVHSDIVALLKDADEEKQLRAVRALGALGGKDATKLVLNRLEPLLLEDNYRQITPLHRHIMQSYLRSLGRLKDEAAYPVLLGLLEDPDRARFAADALVDFDKSDAVAKLIQLYPDYSRVLNSRYEKPLKGPSDDTYTGNNTQDRMLETPFAFASAIARLLDDRAADLAALRKIGPYLVANLPSNWDSGVFYEVETDQQLTAFLLEKAGLRQAVCDIIFETAAEPEKWVPQKKMDFNTEGLTEEQLIKQQSLRMEGDVPYMSNWIPAFCRQNDAARLIKLLDHPNGWLRINAAKSLMFLNAQEGVEPMAELLKASHPEAECGWSGALEHAEYNDPGPRWREAYIRALARLGATQYDELFINLLEDERNVVDIQHAAALALDELGTPAALDALKRADKDHPFHSVRMVAREALWRRGAEQLARQPVEPKSSPVDAVAKADDGIERFVFIKGRKKVRSDFNGQAGVDPWRQTYSVSNSGPTMRLGQNLYILERAADGTMVVKQLTFFTDGYVADCEVSWDAKKIIFAHRRNGDPRNYKEAKKDPIKLREPGEQELDSDVDPWWHIWEINADGTGLRQLTHGPYHDVQPVYLPDDRIAFSSSRIGMRDEYHGFPAIGITVMNSDGSDIQPVGFNLGADREPTVLPDGRIAFARLDIFYSRQKTEMTIQAIVPDGTRNVCLYGPERRGFWMDMHTKFAAWTMRSGYGNTRDNRNRVLRVSQPQPLDGGRLICTSSAGLVVVGPGRYKEQLVPHDRKWATCSPFPLGGDKVVCGATVKQFDINGKIITVGDPEFEELKKGPDLFNSAVNIDLGLYVVDVVTGEMELLYNDPDSAEFEARPLTARRRPHQSAESLFTRQDGYTANLVCSSARISREERVSSRGQLVRVIEGMPVVSRHETQGNQPSSRWKNHGGTQARVLGTVPLAADGSFFVEVPADRLLHMQVLDADRRVVGNQIFWMYARPGESRSCIGCHEKPDSAPPRNIFPASARMTAVKTLPTGGELQYRAKQWIKGTMPDEAEERIRVVRSINIPARY